MEKNICNLAGSKFFKINFNRIWPGGGRAESARADFER